MKLRQTVLVSVAAVAVFSAACKGDANTSVTITAAPPPSPTTASFGKTIAGSIIIDHPRPGASVNVPFEISGTGGVDASILVSVSDVSGTLCERSVQATSGNGTQGTWTANLAFVPALQAEPVTIRASSQSPRDGSSHVAGTELQLTPDVPDILITQPRCAADVPGGTSLAVSGTARVFEATLTAELRASSGAVVAAKQITADAGAPATGRWSTQFDLDGIAAGAYELVAYSGSARDGTAEHVFSIPIRITG